MHDPAEVADAMLPRMARDPLHEQARAALEDGALAEAERLALEAEPSRIWRGYVLAAIAAVRGQPIRSRYVALAGLSLPAASSADRHYTELLRGLASQPVSARPTTVSLCMIVRDAEDSLGRTLSSAREVVQEMVIADTGSTDATVRVAEAAGARVLHVPWNDDFGEARNAALSAAKSEWVLSLDADEEVAPESLAAIRTATSDPSCVFIPVIDNLGANRVFGNIRLFPRVGARWVGRLHEEVVYEGGEPKLAIRDPGFTLRHFGYAPDRVDQEAKRARNLRILSKMREGDATEQRLALVYEAKQWAKDRPDDPETLDLLRRAAEQAEHLPPSQASSVLRMLATELARRERFQEALEVVARAERLGVGALWPAYLRARIAWIRGDRAQAKHWAARGLASLDHEGPSDFMRSQLTEILTG